MVKKLKSGIFRQLLTIILLILKNILSKNNLSKNIPSCSRTPETYINELTQEFTFSEITEQEVYQLLLSLSVTKAPGLEKLPATLVKSAAPYIAKPLAKLFNESLITGILP